MTDRAKTHPSTILLDRSEWEKFVDEVRKLAQAHDRLLEAVAKQDEKTPPWLKGNYTYGRRKQPFSSRVLDFLGFKPRVVTGSCCSYCGSTAEPWDRFCRICGKSIQAQMGIDTTDRM